MLCRGAASFGSCVDFTVRPEGGALSKVQTMSVTSLPIHVHPAKENPFYAQLVNSLELRVGEVWGFPKRVKVSSWLNCNQRMTFTRWTGQRCCARSFTAGIMRSANTLNMCMHPLQFECVIFLPADFICSFLYWGYEVNLSFRVPHNSELRSDL